MATHRGEVAFESYNHPYGQPTGTNHSLPSYLSDDPHHLHSGSSHNGPSSFEHDRTTAQLPAHLRPSLNTHSAPPTLTDSHTHVRSSPSSSGLISRDAYSGPSSYATNPQVWGSSHDSGPTSIHSAPQSFVDSASPGGTQPRGPIYDSRLTSTQHYGGDYSTHSAPSSFESHRRPQTQRAPSSLTEEQKYSQSYEGQDRPPPSRSSAPLLSQGRPVPRPRTNVGRDGSATRQEQPGQHHQPTSAEYRPVPVPRTRAGSASSSTTTQTAYEHSQQQVPHERSAQQAAYVHSQPQAASYQRTQMPSSSSSSHQEDNYSAASLENARYSLESFPIPDHSNEDRYFAVDKGFCQVFAVFDGHDGPRAAGFASNYMRELFETQSWETVVRSGGESIPQALDEFFRVTEKDFFSSIRRYITERNALQARIPQHLKSFEALQLFPAEVNRLQAIEPHLSGGCTAVVAVIANGKLYVANVGDSRAVLIFEKRDGTLAAQQLSVDHGTENEEELRRLQGLGLDPRELMKAGRLGTQENTRSIGDYYIKEGYRNVDTLRSARSQPGTAVPYKSTPIQVDGTCHYLVLMSDGVYKSIEGMFSHKAVVEANKVLLNMLDHALQKSRTFVTVSDNVLARIQQIHQDTYEESARKDPRSPLATACRKRDDMTLLVHKFVS